MGVVMFVDFTSHQPKVLKAGISKFQSALTLVTGLNSLENDIVLGNVRRAVASVQFIWQDARGQPTVIEKETR
jgi:hypothetical protein